MSVDVQLKNQVFRRILVTWRVVLTPKLFHFWGVFVSEEEIHGDRRAPLSRGSAQAGRCGIRAKGMMLFWTALRTLGKAPVKPPWRRRRRICVRPAEKHHKSKHQCADMSAQRRSRHPHGAFASILIFIQYFLRADGWLFFFFFSGEKRKKQPRRPAAAGGWLYLHRESPLLIWMLDHQEAAALWVYRHIKLQHWCQRGIITHIIKNTTAFKTMCDPIPVNHYNDGNRQQYNQQKNVCLHKHKCMQS